MIFIQELDIRYAFILLPIVYSIMPFLLTGNFLLLGSITATIFFIGAVLFVLIFSLNVAGSGNIIASGVSGRLGINQEGTYMLFVLVFGGLFYGVTTFIVSFLPELVIIFNIILYLLSIGGMLTGGVVPQINTHGASLSIGNYIVMSPQTIYPSSLSFSGIPVFLTLSVLMGLIYIAGIFFLISSRGR